MSSNNKVLFVSRQRSNDTLNEKCYLSMVRSDGEKYKDVLVSEQGKYCCFYPWFEHSEGHEKQDAANKTALQEDKMVLLEMGNPQQNQTDQVVCTLKILSRIDQTNDTELWTSKTINHKSLTNPMDLAIKDGLVFIASNNEDKNGVVTFNPIMKTIKTLRGPTDGFGEKQCMSLVAHKEGLQTMCSNDKTIDIFNQTRNDKKPDSKSSFVPTDVHRDLNITSAFDIAIDKEEKQLQVSSDKNNKIQKLNIESGDLKECTHKQLNRPMGLTVKDDILQVANNGGNNILVQSSDLEYCGKFIDLECPCHLYWNSFKHNFKEWESSKDKGSVLMDELKNKSKKGIGRGRGNRNNKESENEEVNSAKNKQQANQQLDISSEDDKRKRDGNNLYQKKNNPTGHFNQDKSSDDEQGKNSKKAFTRKRPNSSEDEEESKKSRGNAANKKANASVNENGTKKRNTNDDVEEKKYKSQNGNNNSITHVQKDEKPALQIEYDKVVNSKSIEDKMKFVKLDPQITQEYLKKQQGKDEIKTSSLNGNASESTTPCAKDKGLEAIYCKRCNSSFGVSNKGKQTCTECI